MADISFSTSDLLRRRFQTSLIIISGALCVASTLFLLSLSDRIGFGILSASENTLTASFSVIFSRFVLLAGFLVFVAGIVMMYFLVHVMMTHRLKDIGLMKAAGCPNDLVFGYFMNELMIISIAAGLLGISLGVLADYLSSSIFNVVGPQVVQWRINPWLTLIIFVAFVVLSVIGGLRPVLTATRVKPTTALSPMFSIGLSLESDFKGVSKAGLTVKMAVRSLFRRKSTNSKIILCLTVVFVLVTVSIAGGIIAKETTANWIERAVGTNTILIAHHEICDQYKLLLSKFYTGEPTSEVNYSDERYLVPEELLNQLEAIPGLEIDSRLMLEAEIREVQGAVLGQDTGKTTTVGDNRKGTSLVIGVEPVRVLGQWFVDGTFLSENGSSEIVVGDTVGSTMFSEPLAQRVTLFKREFRIVGVCVDPLNNGNVTYVPLRDLQNVTGILRPNVIMVKISSATDQKQTLEKISAAIQSTDPEFELSQLDETLEKQLGFLSYMWSTIMLLPLLSLSATALCLIGYVTLTIDEQRQELGILRAIGAKPRTIVKIVMLQNLLVSLPSWAAGIALGTMTTLLVLIPEPFVSSSTIVEIAAWLFLALAAILTSSLYPALRFARKPILEVIGHH